MSRYRSLRAAADLLTKLVRTKRNGPNCATGMRGLTPEVREWLGPFLLRDGLALFRAANIDGDCPEWLAEKARAI